MKPITKHKKQQHIVHVWNWVGKFNVLFCFRCAPTKHTAAAADDDKKKQRHFNTSVVEWALVFLFVFVIFQIDLIYAWVKQKPEQSKEHT